MTLEQDALLIQQLQEAHEYLRKTDHKFLNAYVAKDGKDLEAIETQRNQHREFIRQNET
tara:strand:- start:79 stop:255 length:177 start_codon:yes stop_codon:yes gene_type:complete